MTTYRTLTDGDNARDGRVGRRTFESVARWLRRGLVVATTTAVGVAVAALPAAAEPDGLSIALRPNSVELAVGGAARDLTITVKNNGRRPASGEVELQVPLGDQGVRLTNVPGTCRANTNAMRCGIPDVEPGKSTSIRVRITPPKQSSLAPGDEREGTGKAVVRGSSILDGEGEAEYRVLLSSADIVPEVSGKVVSTDNKPVSDAVIKIKDSAGNQHSTSTSSSGAFRFRASADKPLAPGNLQVTATKDGFQAQVKRVTGRSGQPVRDIRFSLLSASATPTETSTEEEPAQTDGPTTPKVADSTTPAGKETGLGLFGWFLIIMGIVLLGGGTVVIVLLLRRRGDDDGDDDPYEHTGPMPTAGGAPGVYRSGAGGSPPTSMMAGHAAGGMDTPTMLHERPFVSHVADASAASQAARARDGYSDQETRLHPSDLAPAVDPYASGHYDSGQHDTGSYGPGHQNPRQQDSRHHDSGRRDDHAGGASDATQLHPGVGRHSNGPDDGYGSGGRHSHDSGYVTGNPAGDPYRQDGGYDRDGGYAPDDGYGRDGRGHEGYGGGDGYGAPAGGRHGAGDGRRSGHGRHDDDDTGYGGRRRSVQWGDD